MRCIFCKNDSTSSKSIEHIIPESLGNSSLTLPKGIVCDKCNNYFARKVEKPFLERKDVRKLRHYQAITNKKNRIPILEGAIIDDNNNLKMKRKIKDGKVVNSVDLNPDLFNKIKNRKNFEVMLPSFNDKEFIENTDYVSRFLAKMAIETFAHRLIYKTSSLNAFIDDVNFDLLRNYAREGSKNLEWSYNVRRIYDISKSWGLSSGESGQMIYESDIFFLSNGVILSQDADISMLECEVYYIVALFGIEFVINYLGPSIDGYKEWLLTNSSLSPLHLN